jgi:hypothetical protein
MLIRPLPAAQAPLMHCAAGVGLVYGGVRWGSMGAAWALGSIYSEEVGQHGCCLGAGEHILCRSGAAWVLLRGAPSVDQQHSGYHAGGTVGLMGAVAHATLAAGGKVRAAAGHASFIGLAKSVGDLIRMSLTYGR